MGRQAGQTQQSNNNNNNQTTTTTIKQQHKTTQRFLFRVFRKHLFTFMSITYNTIQWIFLSIAKQTVKKKNNRKSGKIRWFRVDCEQCNNMLSATCKHIKPEFTVTCFRNIIHSQKHTLTHQLNGWSFMLSNVLHVELNLY